MPNYAGDHKPGTAVALAGVLGETPGPPVMTGINTEVIADVRQRARLLDVVSELVVLRRAGKDYKGLCPFHDEKTPSFFVNPEKGIFKCFGCGEGGDVFAFIQKTKRLDFVEAVKELARKTGVPLPETAVERGEYDRRSAILLLYQQAAEYYARLLAASREAETARDYLARRGIDEETAQRFRLGFAPPAWDGLLRYLSDSARVSPETLQEAGLVRRKPDTTSYYDLFRNRLVIPIHDEQGRVIAFGGRTLGDDQVKYLNSPESLIYTKGEHLFALHQAREAIREQDAVIVVEGYFDAITAHRHGFRNTVATLGTALTERQAKLLVRFTESRRVYLCFDADAAGEKAVDRGMETLAVVAEGVGMDLRVIRVPGGKDPDECLRSTDEEAGRSGFEAAISGAPSLLDYQLERAVSGMSLSNHTGRIEASKQIVPILASVNNAVMRGEYARQWAARLLIREEDLLADVSQFRRGKRTALPRPESSRAPKVASRAGCVQAELSLLALYLLSKEDYEYTRERLSDERLLDPLHQRVKDAIEGIGRYSTGQDFWAQLQDRLAADLEANRLLPDLDGKVEELRRQKVAAEGILNDLRARLIQERLNQAAGFLWARMKEAPGEEEEVRLQGKIGQLKRLQNSLGVDSRSEEGLEEIKRQLETLLVETTL